MSARLAMEIDLPEVVREVRAAFERYERALVENDIATLSEAFWDSPLAVRYGTTESLYGSTAIKTFRLARPRPFLKRELTNTRITAFGREFAIVNTEFTVAESGKRGRQSQTWAIDALGEWKIVAAHVSSIS